MEMAPGFEQAAMLCMLWLCCWRCAGDLTQMTAVAIFAVLPLAGATTSACHPLWQGKQPLLMAETLHFHAGESSLGKQLCCVL